MAVDCKIARPLRAVNGVFSSRAEAVGLQRRLRNCFRTLEGEQGPVTHIQSSLSMCMSGRACACSLVSVRVYVCARGLLVCVCVCVHESAAKMFPRLLVLDISARPTFMFLWDFTRILPCVDV